MTATVHPVYVGTCVDCGEKVTLYTGGHWISADRDTRRCLGAPEGVVHEVARHVVRVPEIGTVFGLFFGDAPTEQRIAAMALVGRIERDAAQVAV